MRTYAYVRAACLPACPAALSARRVVLSPFADAQRKAFDRVRPARPAAVDDGVRVHAAARLQLQRGFSRRVLVSGLSASPRGFIPAGPAPCCLVLASLPTY